jgi:hypothetical protein
MDQDDRILEGVLFCESEAEWDKKEFMRTAAALLAGQEAWAGTGFTDVMVSKGTSVTRSICRKEQLADNNHRDDWYICAGGKANSATPGTANNPGIYVPPEPKS